jgi:hypothetical protein
MPSASSRSIGVDDMAAVVARARVMIGRVSRG